MSQTIRFEELNDEAREYLTKVRDSGGRKMPGIFIRSSSSLPVWGLFGGIATVVLTVLVTLFSDIILGSPKAVACLQTAGIVAGGWMVVAAFRVWSAKTSDSYAGHWYYADGSNFYRASGDSISLTPLDRIREAKGTQNLNDGVYTHTQITISIKGDNRSLTIKDQKGARDLVIFLNALAYLIHEADDAVRDFAPHIHGGLARECALRGDFPTDFVEEDVAVSEIPAMRADNSASSGLMPMLAIAGATLFVWLIFSQINIGVRDHAIYEIVKSNPKPQNLRAYLLDERNSAHRTELEGWLKQRYANVTSGIATSGNATNQPPKDKEMSAKMIQILDAIALKSPVVSLRVRETIDPSVKNFSKTSLPDDLWNSLSRELCDGVGPEYIAMVKLTEDLADAPAMIDIEYVVSADAGAPGVYAVQWKVALRTGPEEAGLTRAWKQQAAIAAFPTQMGLEPARIRARILGGYRNSDQPLPPNFGENGF